MSTKAEPDVLATWKGSGASILSTISEQYGLTGLELRHYKAEEGMKYEGPVGLFLMTLAEVRSVAMDIIRNDKFLMVYENVPLQVCVVVRKSEVGPKP